MHKKINISEIKPSYEEITALFKLVNEYKKLVSDSEMEKYNKELVLKVKYNKDKEKAKDEYNQIILNSKKNLEIELKNNENNYYQILVN